MDEHGNIYPVLDDGTPYLEQPQDVDGKPTPKQTVNRIVEKQTGPLVWERTRLPLLQPGDVFRMFESDGQPVHGGAHFRAKGTPFVNNNGQYTVDVDILKKRKIGRNDPCLCGSGKKYKKCCIGIERPDFTPCSTCDGTGSVSARFKWGDDHSPHVMTSCPECAGSGKVTV